MSRVCIPADASDLGQRSACYRRVPERVLLRQPRSTRAPAYPPPQKVLGAQDTGGSVTASSSATGRSGSRNRCCAGRLERRSASPAGHSASPAGHSASPAGHSASPARQRADRWIRWTTTGCVALLALIAATVSYLHMHMLVELHGQPGWVAALTPFSVDGMIVAASTTLLADSRSPAG